MLNITDLKLFSKSDLVAWVGAGGKSTLIFTLAKTLFTNCVITTSTHFGSDQIYNADHYTEIKSIEDISSLGLENFVGTHLITGSESKFEAGKITGLSEEPLILLFSKCKKLTLPVFIEADGSKMKPIKAPAGHEPAIPGGVNKVCVVIGLSAINQPITSETVHRPELIANILNKQLGEQITWEDVYELAINESGSQKSIPCSAEKYLFLHQSDCISKKEDIHNLAVKCKPYFKHVLITKYNQTKDVIEVEAHFGSVGCVVLAAGESKRFGSPKQLAIWNKKTFIENIMDEVSRTCLKPNVVVTGAFHEDIDPFIVRYQNITNLYNPDWQSGQASSVKTGLLFLKNNVEAIIFLLVDQPQININMINKVIITYACLKPNIIVHKFENKNRHPVLFSKNTFTDLLEIQGDSGGRQLFSKFIPFELIIKDSLLAVDFDSPESLTKRSEPE